MAILVFINVIARFVFNNPLAVADEMSCYLFVLMSFMGTAIAARRKAHLGLTLLTDKLSPNAARIVPTVMSQYQMGQQTATMQWPEWIYGLFVPLGGAFSMVAFLDGTIKIAKGDN